MSGNGNGNGGNLLFPAGLDGLDITRFLAEEAYAAHMSKVEVKLLVAAGMPEPEARTLVASKRAEFENFLERAWTDHKTTGRRTVVGWGAASNDSLVAEISELIFAFAHKLVVPAKVAPAIVHGSSETGFMGVWDRAWVAANAHRNGSDPAPIRTVPLRWTVKEVREPPALNNHPLDRCPPMLTLGPRTDTFPLAGKMAMIVSAPAGVGGRKEVCDVPLYMQLRDKVPTWFSAWKGPLPPLVLLDHFQDTAFIRNQVDAMLSVENGTEDSPFYGQNLDYDGLVRHLESQDLTLSDYGLNPGWHFDGLANDWRRLVVGRTARQDVFSNIVVLRMGDGKNIDSDLHFGPKVIYRPDVDSASDYLVQLYGEAV